MASDTEQLILSISADTAQVKRALDRLTGDAKKAGNDIAKSFDAVGRTDPVGRMQQNLSRSMRAMNQDAKVLSFQLTDITQGLASGQSPFIVMNQQIGQVMQSLTGAGLSGALRTLRGAFAISLPTLALLGAVELVKLFFSSAEDGSKKAEKALADQQAKLKELIKTYADFLHPETKKIIIDIARTAELEAARKEAQKLGDQLLAAGKTGLADAMDLIRQRLRDVKTPPELLPNLNALAGVMKNFLATVEAGGDPMENVRRVLAEIAKLDMAEPNKGWKELGDLIRNSVLPNLKQYQKTQSTVNDLVKTTGELTEEQIKSHEDAKKALEEMKKVGVAAMTDIQKLWEQYAITIKDSTGDLKLHQQALEELLAAQGRLQFQAEGAIGGAIGTSGDFISKVMQAESGGKNIANIAGTSSAFGLFQFTKNSFVDAVHMIPEFANASRESIIAQRGNVELQKRAMEAFTKDNAEYLSQHHIVINDATRYLAHFLGKAGAVALLNAPPGTSVRQAVGRDVVRANPFTANMTREDLLAWAGRKMGMAQTELTVADIREQNDALSTQAQIEGEITNAFDARIAKQQEALKLDELMRAARKKALDEHRDLTAAEIAGIEKEAAAYGKLQGQIEGTKQAQAFAGDIQGVLERAAAIEAENTALGNLGTVIDEVTYKRIYAVTVQQLMQKASEDGTAATQNETVAIQNAAAALARAEAAKVGWTNTSKAAADSAKQLQQQLSSMTVSAIGGFIQDLRNGVDAGEAFNNMLNRIIDSLINMALQMAVKSLFDPAGGGGLLSKLFSVAHSGGIVGQTAFPQRRVDPRVFIGAPRMATGGLVGGEVPIIAHRGEMVIPKSMVGRGAPVQEIHTSLGDVNVDMSATGMVAANSEDARQFGRNVQRLIQNEMVAQSRPGGLLRRVPG